jgi:hypothetical protein
MMNPAIIELALTVILKYAPQLYLDFVLIFAKGEPTAEDKKALSEKLERLVHPEDYYKTPPTVVP